MIGEFGGIGAFVLGKEWKPKSCHTYLHVDTPHDEATTYIKMAATIESRVDHVSASVYTQVGGCAAAGAEGVSSNPKQSAAAVDPSGALWR